MALSSEFTSNEPVLNPILETVSPGHPFKDEKETEQTTLVKLLVDISCDDPTSLTMTTLDVLFVVASETDWGLKVVLKHAPIHVFEQLCEKMPPSNCRLFLPKLLLLIGMSSEDENVRICESSIPSSLLVRFVPTRNEHVRTAIGKCLLLMTSTPRSSSAFLSRHEASFRATLEEIEDSGLSQLFLESLAAIMFSPNTTVLTLVCQSLDRHARRREIAASFLARHTLLFTLAGPPDNPVMFTERLGETLSDRLSRLQTLLADSKTQPNKLVEGSTIAQICWLTEFVVSGYSLLDYLRKDQKPSKDTVMADCRFNPVLISAIDASLRATKDLVSTSTSLSSSTVTSLRHIVEIVTNGFGSLVYRLDKSDTHFRQVLITQRFFPLVKATITTCLHLQSHVASIPADQKAGLSATINSALTMSWKIITRSLDSSMKDLHPAVESAFADGSDMFSLIERTSQQLNTNLLMDLLSHTNGGSSSLRTVSIFLKENMIERVLTRVQPSTVPLADRAFHEHLLSLISNMSCGTALLSWRPEARPSEPLLHFNRVVVPAKRYLMFVLQRDEYVYDPSDAFVSQLNQILKYIILLEKELHREGKDVETGREEWEVGWLVEMSNKKNFKERLHSMEEDKEMRKKEKKRWKKRAARLRQAGLDDALEAWLTPRETYDCLLRLNKAVGMNHVNLAFQRHYRLF
ncbi:hypothetical protein BLNAU_19321 [Blattamonas nauphoetae]|uniref:Uncharacterized protein n=1 Tax=Blattamonas nauphoetae TaxID=2049346 RepID=A0ABQ9X251_9EUKA|nr:hypothetical protein BLNAU_19321 [Blattamonas nauphoetae]